VRDAAERSGADVHIRLWFYLPRAADLRDQVLTYDFAGRNLRNAGLAMPNNTADNAGYDKQDDRDKDDFLDAHSGFLTLQDSDFLLARAGLLGACVLEEFTARYDVSGNQVPANP
jgi:hypothetical protein